MVVVVIIIGIIIYFVSKNGKKVVFKSKEINTFNTFYSSASGVQYNKRCTFYEHQFANGESELVIKISGLQPMKFNLINEPYKVGDGVFFMMSSIDSKIQNINMIMSENSAHITFPDKSILTFE